VTAKAGEESVEKLRIGIIGCGAIAQIQYLPLLRQMSDAFAIAGLSDLSSTVLSQVGDSYGVPKQRRFQSYDDLVQSEIDAVVICNSGSHAPPSIAAAKAGKHLLVEKPMATTPEEAKAMVDASDASGVTLMVGYMKRHDPAYHFAASAVRQMEDVRFAQTQHLHPNNRNHLAKFPLIPATDLSQAVRDEGAAIYADAIAAMLGYDSRDAMPAAVKLAFSSIHGSMIHDIGNLSGLFGPPERVISTEIWSDGAGIATTLAYASGLRAQMTWIDLPDLNLFDETLAVYGARERVVVSFPTGFSIGTPSTVTTMRIGDDGHPSSTFRSWDDNTFAHELRHLKWCVETGNRPITNGRDAVADIALVRDIVLAYTAANR